MEDGPRRRQRPPIDGRLAAGLDLLDGLLLGRRWDPRAEEAFDRAERRAPGDPRIARARAHTAFHHGQWDALDELAVDREIEPLLAAAARMRGEENRADPTVDDLRRIGESSHRSGHGGEGLERMAELRALRLPAETKMALLRQQWLSDPLPQIFYRLTRLIVQGRAMQQDVSAEEAQLADLRAMVEAQPNPRLFGEY